MKTGYRFFTRQGAHLASVNGDLIWPEKLKEWVEHTGPLEMCRSGLHYSTGINAAFRHRQGEVLAKVEIQGSKAEEDGKGVCRKARILAVYDQKQMVALALCASIRVLHNFEKQVPGDDRPRKAIEAVIDWIDGKATIEKVREARDAESAASAARSAASAARSAESAAWSAAWSAADAARSAADAAWSAASAADAARSAARKAFIKKFDRETSKLLELPIAKIPAALRKMLPANGATK